MLCVKYLGLWIPWLFMWLVIRVWFCEGKRHLSEEGIKFVKAVYVKALRTTRHLRCLLCLLSLCSVKKTTNDVISTLAATVDTGGCGWIIITPHVSP